MKIWDCHVHCMGGETAADVLRQMDEGGITRATLLSEFPVNFRGSCPPMTRAAMHASAEHIIQLQRADPERIFGVFWADPCSEGILEEIEWALTDGELHGIKLIPNHWSPGDEFMFPIYEKVRELGKLIMSHAGILFAFGDSSRFCQPVLYEALLDFPGLRFSLAHIGWPWTDECLAVFGHFRSAASSAQVANDMWIDTCRGTPDAWRLDALHKAVSFCGTDRLMFGTDGTVERLGEIAKLHVEKDLELMRDAIGVTEAQLEEFFWGAAEAFHAGT